MRRRANATTPHDLLSQAIDVLRVRPILLQRHRNQAERALANVDLYLSFSRAYAVRGLRAFAETMTAAWTDESRAVEGRSDAQEEAVALYTMHAAKGLEWPIVVPVNTMTQVMAPESAVTDRASGRFYCPVFSVKPTGYEAARDAERAELDRERIRLWYVAATRARELLILPRLDVAPRTSAWISLIDLSLAELPTLDLGHLPLEVGAGAARKENRQTREIFAAEAAAICQWHKRENVVSYLSKSEQSLWRKRLQRAYGRPTHKEALEALEQLHRELEERNQSAASSLEEGLEETLTLHRLGVTGARSLTKDDELSSPSMRLSRNVARRSLEDFEPTPTLARDRAHRHRAAPPEGDGLPTPSLREALKRELKIETAKKNTSRKNVA